MPLFLPSLLNKERAPLGKPIPYNPNHSSQFITDDMLAPYFPESLPTSQIELIVSCKEIMSTHTIRQKSNPFCVIALKRPWQKDYKEIARTETIQDSTNPQWMKKIIIDYSFEIIQQIRFEILDKDLKKGDYLGRYETTLSKLVASYGCQSIGKLNGKVDGTGYKSDAGEIIIVSEEVANCKLIAEIQFAAENLPKTALFRSSNPFLAISRSNEDRSYSIVTKTQQVQSSQSPTFDAINIRLTALCNADFDRQFKIDCYDHRENGNHKLIGTCYASTSHLISMNKDSEQRDLVNEEKQRTKASYVAKGALKVEKIEITEDNTFLDYVRHGTQMHFAVAIDFTASNGEYTDPKSLHYLSDGKMNNYEIALHSIGDIIQQYDHSHIFPAFGFGAKLPPSGQLSFQFPLNGNPDHPYCSDVNEIIKHYREQLKVVELFGPTNFAPTVNNTIAIAKEYQDGKHYFVLLIITDGVISDMRLTKSAIIEASKLPISIIIVGVGDDDFEAMNELDSDNVRLTDGVHFAERDIVQFVPLNKFLSKDGPYVKSQADLAEEVLAEIPDQLTSYMKSRGFKPDMAPTLPPDSSAIVPTAPLATDT